MSHSRERRRRKSRTAPSTWCWLLVKIPTLASAFMPPGQFQPGRKIGGASRCSSQAERGTKCGGVIHDQAGVRQFIPELGARRVGDEKLGWADKSAGIRGRAAAGQDKGGRVPAQFSGLKVRKSTGLSASSSACQKSFQQGVVRCGLRLQSGLPRPVARRAEMVNSPAWKRSAPVDFILAQSQSRRPRGGKEKPSRLSWKKRKWNRGPGPGGRARRCRTPAWPCPRQEHPGLKRGRDGGGASAPATGAGCPCRQSVDRSGSGCARRRPRAGVPGSPGAGA